MQRDINTDLHLSQWFSKNYQQYKKIQIIQYRYYEKNSSEMGIYWIQTEQPVSTLPVQLHIPAQPEHWFCFKLNTFGIFPGVFSDIRLCNCRFSDIWQVVYISMGKSLNQKDSWPFMNSNKNRLPGFACAGWSQYKLPLRHLVRAGY